MLKFKDFILEKKDIHFGDFNVTVDMVTDGKFNVKIPGEITGAFNCSCVGLTSLKGGPKKVRAYYDVRGNKLTDLVGAPKETRHFYCNKNKLSTLKGCPKAVVLQLSENFLTNLEYFPLETIDSTIKLEGNKYDLNVELGFILSGRCSSTEPKEYWPSLLKYMIDEKIDLDKVKGWPKGFLTPELIQSVKGINKFNL